MGLSIKNLHLSECLVRDLTGDGTGNAYGVSLTRKADTSDTTNYPFSSDCIVTNNIIKDIPTWHALSTHAGNNPIFSNNYIENCQIGVHLGSTTGDDSVDFASANHCVVDGNVIYGIGTGNGIECMNGNINEANIGAGNVISNNTLTDCGIDDDASNGAIIIGYTKGTIITGNSIYTPYSNGISLYYKN